jgi:hypothetical protein
MTPLQRPWVRTRQESWSRIKERRLLCPIALDVPPFPDRCRFSLGGRQLIVCNVSVNGCGRRSRSGDSDQKQQACTNHLSFHSGFSFLTEALNYHPLPTEILSIRIHEGGAATLAGAIQVWVGLAVPLAEAVAEPELSLEMENCQFPAWALVGHLAR